MGAIAGSMYRCLEQGMSAGKIGADMLTAKKKWARAQRDPRPLSWSM